MRVLAVSDVESRRLYDYYRPGMLDGFDLIISCGDLRPAYLEFLVTMAGCPLLYVHGNHDGRYEAEPPGGCTCIDGKLLAYQGVRFLGLGGSYRYNGGPHQYDEGQMRRRALRKALPIALHGGFDVLVGHAPAHGINDTDAPAHRGFETFLSLMDRYRPRCFVHGHMHLTYGMNIPRREERGSTTILNAYDHVAFEV